MTNENEELTIFQQNVRSSALHLQIGAGVKSCDNIFNHINEEKFGSLVNKLLEAILSEGVNGSTGVAALASVAAALESNALQASGKRHFIPETVGILAYTFFRAEQAMDEEEPE